MNYIDILMIVFYFIMMTIKKIYIVELFRNLLKYFKLFINESKTKHLIKPIYYKYKYY